MGDARGTLRRRAESPAREARGDGDQLAMSPIVRAVLDWRDEAIVVYNARGEALYRNAAAQATDGTAARAQLIARGGRAIPLYAERGGTLLGEVVVVPRMPLRTLAEHEREAIRQMLEHTGGQLAETARRLGISRTTLWRRRKSSPS